MQWYYAIKDQRQGPIAEAEFEQLVSDGTITGDTLVWREGMTGWQPYSSVAGGGAAPVVAGGGDDTEVCAASGKRYPKRDMLQYEGKWIAAEHRDAYFQRLREGVAQPGVGVVPGPYGYGGFWRRFFARIIDGLIQSIPIMILSFGVGMYYGASGDFQATSTGDAVMLQLMIQGLAIAVALSYEVFFVRKYDATPGKLAMGLKLLRSDGSKLSVGRIVGRYFSTFLSGFILGIGYLMAAFDSEKRALHDRIAETRVIKTR